MTALLWTGVILFPSLAALYFYQAWRDMMLTHQLHTPRPTEANCKPHQRFLFGIGLALILGAIACGFLAA